MPELPEVETVARGLAARVQGLVIADVTLRRQDIVHGNGGSLHRLVGRRIAEVCRRGKQVHIQLQSIKPGRERSGREKSTSQNPVDALTMVVHLGMTGRLTAVDASEPIEQHTHLSVDLVDSPLQVRFCDPRRFGGIWLVCSETCATSRWKGRRLPPVAADPLQIPLADLRAMLARRRQIKALLMDQQPLSGMGNIYCDEALHRAGIHPLTSAANLDAHAVRRLHQAIRRVLSEAIRAGGSSVSDYRTANNIRGAFQKRHRVYGRAGEPCATCKTPIERLLVAGRGTHICPCCQPRPV